MSYEQWVGPASLEWNSGVSELIVRDREFRNVLNELVRGNTTVVDNSQSPF